MLKEEHNIKEKNGTSNTFQFSNFLLNCIQSRDAPDTDLTGYPANLKPETGYPVEPWIPTNFGSKFKYLLKYCISKETR
jgi:hypothetical protein